MLVVVFFLGLMPVLAVAGVLALQQKWYALAAFAGVILAIFMVLFGLAILLDGEPQPGERETVRGASLAVIVGFVALAFADLASLLALPALFLRWERDESGGPGRNEGKWPGPAAG